VLRNQRIATRSIDRPTLGGRAGHGNCHLITTSFASFHCYRSRCPPPHRPLFLIRRKPPARCPFCSPHSELATIPARDTAANDTHSLQPHPPGTHNEAFCHLRRPSLLAAPLPRSFPGSRLPTTPILPPPESYLYGAFPCSAATAAFRALGFLSFALRPVTRSH
jgi:hypothetical protein